MTIHYMIDTSVWIDYFRDTDSELNDFIDLLLDEDRVYINGIIRAEILIGARNTNEYESIKNSLEGIHTVEMDNQTFNETGRIGFQLKRKGITVPLSDLIIAVQCALNRLTLIQKDKHYQCIKECLEIDLYSTARST